MKVLFLMNKALIGLKLLFDPAVEGNPYEKIPVETHNKVIRQERTRLILRKRLAIR